MKALEDIIKRQIIQTGPMTIGTYMDLCLAHPQYGYYRTRDPLGQDGDFTTSPEISQLFGEMIGFWIADIWARMGAPWRVHLVELGPGRGTLMADLLRVTEGVPGFQDAVRVHLVETSPVLQRVQNDKVKAPRVFWHDSLDKVPVDGPIFLVANEFFDALPVRQIVKTAAGFEEIMVGMEMDRQLCLGRTPADPAILSYLPPDMPDEALVEVSPVTDRIFIDLCTRVKNQGGAAIIIDYGALEKVYGSTIQALHKHEKIDPLERCGEADVTAHVNFSRLKHLAEGAGVSVCGPVTQEAFLKNLGIEARIEKVVARATEKQKNELYEGMRRLIDTAQMGDLFKVLAISQSGSAIPAGFGT